VAQGFIEVTMIALNKKPKARKCIDHHRISLIPHVAKIVASVIRGRLKRKLRAYLEMISFGFRKGNGTIYAIRMLSISERTLDILTYLFTELSPP
jgi:hypothetical protein